MAFTFSRASRRSGGRLSGSLAGLAAGAGLMYLLDPRRGPARRSRAAQRAGRALRGVEGTVEAGARDLKHRVRGLAHEAAARVERDHASDEVIVERVRARLGRLSSHPSAVRVVSHAANVTLEGPIFAAEHAQVLRGVRRVRGVRSVEDRLEPHDGAEGVPALQGSGPRPGPRPDPLQRHWAPRTRLLAGVAGTLLLGRALFGRGLGRFPAAVAGAGLLGKLVAPSEPLASEARRAARASSRAAVRAREGRLAGEEHAGAWHGDPEQAEVVGRGASYFAGEPGDRVREADLGAVAPREDGEEGAARGDGDEGAAGGPTRGEPT